MYLTSHIYLPRVRKESSQDTCRADYEVLRTSVFFNSQSSLRTFQPFILIEEMTSFFLLSAGFTDLSLPHGSSSYSGTLSVP